MLLGSSEIDGLVWEKMSQARRDFLTSVEREGAIPEILRRLQELLGLKNLVVYAFDKSQETLTKACQASKHFAHPNVPLSDTRNSLAGRAALSGQSHVESIRITHGRETEEAIDRSEVRIAVPIQIPGQTIGVLLAQQAGNSLESWKVQALESVAIDLGIFVENWKNSRNLRQQISLDDDTGLYKHSRFLELLEIELDRARRNDSPLTILLLDFTAEPPFSEGPPGEELRLILRETAQLLRGTCRTSDVLGRSAGNGIVAALGAVNTGKSLLVAERLYQLILTTRLSPPISVNIGIASYPSQGLDKEELLFTAQLACRLARHCKGNRIFTIGKDRMKSTSFRAFSGLFAHGFQIGPQTATQFATYIEEMSSDPEFASLAKETVESLARAIDAKDNYTKNHCEEATLYAEALGGALGLEAKELELVKMSVKLHDLGKIGIPESILNKPGPLDEAEWWVMKEHPTIGAKILAPIKSLTELVPIVQCHHECWNGTGYPMGLREREIPLGARIIGVIDSFHAIISKRPYKDARPVDFALSELRRQSGTHFDPEIVDVFCSLFDSDGNLRERIKRKQAARMEEEVRHELVEMLAR